MSPLEEIRKLIILDPRGWKCAYDGADRLTDLTYNGLLVRVSYRWYHGDSDRTIAIYPGGQKLGWLDTIRFDRLVKLLTSTTVRSFALEVAAKMVADRDAEVQRELEALDSVLNPDLMAEFAVLEAADSERKRAVKEAPIATGFLTGVKRKLVDKHG